MSQRFRGQSEMHGLFEKFAAKKKNLVAIISHGHVSGSWKTMFYLVFGSHNSVN